MLEHLREPDPDPILALGARFRADDRPTKLDLGIGVFRDEEGQTPIMRSVYSAERHLAATRTSKTYVGARGDLRFAEVMRELVFGEDAPAERIGALQTPGGTGALRVLASLIARARPGATVWLSDPTWLNHRAVFADAGLKTATYPYYDKDRAGLRLEEMTKTLAEATAGDVVVLHGCCHNPTGADLSDDDWSALATLFEWIGLIPLVDLAYQGFGRGLDEDALGVRILAAAVPEMMVASSCSKNFGIYSERTGSALIQAATPAAAEIAAAQMTLAARVLYSMPPDHGSAIVRTIWDDPALRSDWKGELEQMRRSMVSKRSLLADELRTRLGADIFDHLTRQAGMFSLLNLESREIDALRQQHGVYLVADGRINIAGIAAKDIPDFADRLVQVRGRTKAG